jgi:uncharacterized protein HemY
MRIIIYAVIFYLLFLLLRYLLRLYLNYSRSRSLDKGKKRDKRSRIDFNNIEEADFEEVKKKKDGEKN